MKQNLHQVLIIVSINLVFFAATVQSQSQPLTCESEGFYPNPNDCSKFYRCVDYTGDGSSFTIFNFDCGPGTLFNPELSVIT